VTPADLRLATSRLLLRPPELADAAALWPYVSDPELPRFMSWDAHRDLAETTTWLASTLVGREQGTDLVWLLLYDRAPAGVIGLHGITRQLRAWRVDRAELGYWVAPPFQGRGFVTEAAREVMRFGFGELALHKITVGCISENVRSRRVIEKLGFRYLGEQRDHLFRFGRWWNHRAYELCVDEPSPG
jgi:RimJ/RimL family protein N-acetyltransferase